MAAVITGVEAGSPAARAGIEPGETLLSVSGHPVRDVLDYRFYTYDARLTLTLDRAGARRTVSVRKAEGADLGLTFESYLMDAQHRCQNRCVFCFVDQLPRGLRPSLYFKDDDARLSFLLGQYITLTNLSEEEMRRICAQRISPLHISVHATDPEVRRFLLGNRHAGDCLPRLRRLAEHGVEMHTQVVVCPDMNDGAVLARTLADLTALYPAVASVSVVPVGLTGHREGLCPIIPFDGPRAAAVLAAVDAASADCRARHGVGVVYGADELYLLSGRPLPPEAAYDGYPQLENGVGMLRLFETEFLQELEIIDMPESVAPFTLATGRAAAPFLRRLMGRMARRLPTLPFAVVAVENRLFGPGVTVAGLLSGRDLIAALAGRVEGRRVFIPQSVLRHDGDVCLDDVSPAEIARAVGAPVTPVPNDGAALVRNILSAGGVLNG
ncbi:MAG: DUF512 domain-containing protein [Oscillospiraceae bacterium]|jgi:putative radical SAM enzyme (TIGR03279 family)|nr:DUF512 domain-containing protein [Oscillospiraceae bacterium]